MRMIWLLKINQTLMQREYDRGGIKDISKYASIKENKKYIKVTSKVINES